ncbi:YceI family protein [Hyphobacterium sp.]|uniref:YceI family protein n=1 Tax=Hyphobacterium sp. TaxID=2004662 RepID=UPI003B519D35
MIRFAFAFAALAAIAAPAVAQDRYEIDPAHTQAVFSVDRFGFTTIFGSFMESGGTITIDADNPAQSAVTAFVETGSVFVGHPVRDEHVAGAFWLNAEAHPRLTFESTSVTLSGDDEAEVSGELTLWGETRNVTFNVALNRQGTDPATQRQAVGFTITGAIDRTEWGHETAAAIIGTEVGIRIETLAHLIED